MDKYIIVFCEGDHDVNFLIRILMVNGYAEYDKKVKDFIKPLNNLYITALKNKKIEESQFKFQRANSKVPYAVYKKDGILVILHNLDGDNNVLGMSEKIRQVYLSLNDAMPRNSGGYEPLKYRFLYFLDADNQGIDVRLDEVNRLFDREQILAHHKIVSINDYEVGSYIFHQRANDFGTLEDVLLELMEDSNKKIFTESRKFINSNRSYAKGKKQFKEKKAIISVAGQFQFSGSNNSVIIKRSDYIKPCDIVKSIVCQNIMSLFD